MCLSGEEDPRLELIRLLEGDEEEQEGWRITYETALKPGRTILPRYQGHFGAYAIVRFILDRLRMDFPWHKEDLGSGCQGIVMNNADGKGLYIKLTIDEMAVILSFHVSKHYRGE